MAEQRVSSQDTDVLISGNEPRLVAALDGALRRTGWATLGAATARSDPPLSGPLLHVLVLTGPTFSSRVLPDGMQHVLRTAVVGPRSAARALSAAVAWGAATVIDSDQPFLKVLAQLDGALRGTDLPDRRDVAARLRDQAERSTAIARLTTREQVVLARLVEGRTAGEIADTAHISLATVRTHIRQVLSASSASTPSSRPSRRPTGSPTADPFVTPFVKFISFDDVYPFHPGKHLFMRLIPEARFDRKARPPGPRGPPGTRGSNRKRTT